MITKDETIESMCRLLSRVHDTTAQEWDEPCDCFCVGREPARFRSSGEAVAIVEEIVGWYVAMVTMGMAIKRRVETNG